VGQKTQQVQSAGSAGQAGQVRGLVLGRAIVTAIRRCGTEGCGTSVKRQRLVMPV